MSPVDAPSSLETREEQYESLDASGVEDRVRRANLRMSQEEFIQELLQKNSELATALREKENIIKNMEMQIADLNHKISVSSIGFDLPEDYYENDEYLV